MNLYYSNFQYKHDAVEDIALKILFLITENPIHVLGSLQLLLFVIYIYIKTIDGTRAVRARAI